MYYNVKIAKIYNRECLQIRRANKGEKNRRRTKVEYMNMKMIVDSIGNFDFNVLLAGFNDSSHVLTQVELISLIVLGVLGIGICLTGWKFVRVWAVIFGFVSGTVGGAAAAYFAGLTVDYIWMPGLVVGVILTALSIWKKKVGGFWLCWLMTALVGVHLLKPDSVILWGVCIGVGLLVAVVFIWFSSIVTIFVTSIFGGMVTGSCIYYLIPVNMRWIHIVLCIVAAVLGVWIQMLMESGKQKKSNLKTAEKIRENNSTQNDVERARNWIDEVEEDDQMVEEDQMEKEDASEVEEEEYYFDEEDSTIEEDYYLDEEAPETEEEGDLDEEDPETEEDEYLDEEDSEIDEDYYLDDEDPEIEDEDYYDEDESGEE